MYPVVITHVLCCVELRDEAATPGGLNEQSVNVLRASPHFDQQTEVRCMLIVYCYFHISINNYYSQSLEAIYARLTKK